MVKCGARLPIHLVHPLKDEHAVVIHALGPSLEGSWQNRGEPCRLFPADTPSRGSVVVTTRRLPWIHHTPYTARFSAWCIPLPPTSPMRIFPNTLYNVLMESISPTDSLRILRRFPSPWLKSTTLVKPSHRRLANGCLSKLPCLS